MVLKLAVEKVAADASAIVKGQIPPELEAELHSGAASAAGHPARVVQRAPRTVQVGLAALLRLAHWPKRKDIIAGWDCPMRGGQHLHAHHWGGCC